MRLKLKCNDGFTMVEIMVVVAILALLLAIVIPYYVKQRASAQASGCINNLTKIEAAANEFALEKGMKTGDLINYPGDLKPYIKLTKIGDIPVCPANGTYHMTAVGAFPGCSLSNSVTPPHIVP
jgi:prepilin-type N-terminal cleavage/methylation domain-containing protein